MSDRYQITAPDFTAPLVHRERLTRDLEDHLDRRLILVIAPAGYGKTTFLADFTHSTEIPVCWVRLTAEERDPTQLGNLIWQSLTKRFRRLRKTPYSSRGKDDDLQFSPQVINQVVDANIPEDHILLIDDLQNISTSSNAITFLNSFLKNLPQQETLILAGRQLPELSIAQLAATDQIKNFGYSELCLNLDELETVVNTRNVDDFSKENALRLLGETEGWITGVILSPLIQNELDYPKGTNFLINAYFEDIAYSRLDSQTKDFLVRTCLLPVLSADLCDHALDIENSEIIIDRLLNSGVYLHIERNFPERLLRYQRQYSTFLKTKVEKSSEWVSQLSKSATTWYLENGFPEFAFSLCDELGDYKAASNIVRVSSGHQFSQANVDILKWWARRLAANGFEMPDLYRQIAYIEAYEGNLETAEHYYQRALKLLVKDPDPVVLIRILDGKFLIDRDFGNHENANDLLNKMAEVLTEIPSYEKARYYVSLMEYQLGSQRNLNGSLETFSKARKYAKPQILQRALNDKGKALGLLGRLMEAYQTFEEAYKLCIDHRIDQAKSIALINLGTTAHYLGRYFEAHARYQQSLTAAVEIKNSRLIPWALMSLGDLLTDLRLFDSAENHYREALGHIYDSAKSELHGLIRIGLSRCLRMRRDKAAVSRILVDLDFSQNDWHFNSLLAIERSYKDYYSNPKKRLEYLADFLYQQEVTQLGQLLIDIECVKCLLDLDNRDEAISRFEGLLELIGKQRLYHFVAVELGNHSGLMNMTRSSNTREARKSLAYFEEIERVRTRFQIINSDPSGGKPIFRALGSVEIRDGERNKISLKPKHFETLIFLLDNEKASTHEITEDFWRDYSPRKQASNLHAAIYQIRKSLGSKFIVKSAGRYQVKRSVIQYYDVNAFELAASRALQYLGTDREFIGIIEEALSLYQGEFMPGYYSNWVSRRREELNHQYVELVNLYTRLAIRQKTPEIALSRIQTALKHNDLNEGLIRSYLEAMSVLGRYHDAIITYRRYEKKMAEELQLKPSPRVRTLAEQIQSRVFSDLGTLDWLQ